MTLYAILNYIYFVLLLLAIIITSRIFQYKQIPLYLKLFPPFLLLTLISESIGLILNEVFKMSNVPLINSFTILEFVYYFYILQHLIDQKTVKKIIQVSIFAYPVIALLNIFFIQGFNTAHTYTLFLGALLIIVAGSTYFLEVLWKEELGTAIHQPSFWICAGLMFFYTVYIPVIAALALPRAHEIFNTNIITVFQVFPNYILYSLYTFGFISFYKLNRSIIGQPQPHP